MKLQHKYAGKRMKDHHYFWLYSHTANPYHIVFYMYIPGKCLKYIFTHWTTFHANLLSKVQMAHAQMVIVQLHCINLLVVLFAQCDIDQDGIGDCCQPPLNSASDDDHSYLGDNCESDTNHDQANLDKDYFPGDVCDDDDDGDNFDDAVDNCPLVYNPQQKGSNSRSNFYTEFLIISFLMVF